MTSSTRPSGGTRDRLVDALRTIERLKRELAAANSAAAPAVEPIAVVGMSCRLPGGADDPGEFWRLLGEGFDAAREFPADRADARSLYDPDPDAPGRAYTITGSFLDRVDLFEPEVFGIAPREAVGMDPQQRITLEVAWEALERAGHAPDRLDGTSTGVYLGVSTTDYVRLRQELGDWAEVDAYTRVGAPSFIAGRIAYTLGLQGPAKVMDTTCSSSLVAVHEACQALRLGECDLALAGGANVMLAPYGFLLMSKFRALSPDGRCKTFDAAADGYGRGEGVGVVVLRRLSDALRDHDHIHALVRGSAVNHDGRSSGLTVPNPAAQQAVVRAALSQAGVDPAEVSYVEAHGTGTSLGDPIELRALEAVVGRHRPGGEPLRVGSVKTNIGHLESAAGIAGLIKLVLAVENGEIPPHLHLRDPNPNVDWDALHITVPTERSPWTGPRVGGLSSFGASGTNAHAVVSEAPGATARSGPDGAAGPGVLVASARTPEALRELADRWARHLAAGPAASVADVCWTSQVGRAHQQHGLAVVGRTLDELAEGLAAHAAGSGSPRLVVGTQVPHRQRRTGWLFTGQGSQWAGMAGELAAEPAFRAAFDRVAQLAGAQLDRPLREVVWPEEGTETPLDDTGWTQPALFAVEYALAQLWTSWGVRPVALAGHSVGEIAAACVAGVLSLEDAVTLVCTRGRLMSALPAGGAMRSAACSEGAALAAIDADPEVAIAGVNAPDEVVLSGPEPAVAAVRARLEADGIRTRPLVVSHAFHSALMEPMLAEFRTVLAGLRFSAPRIPLVSNVTGALWTDAEVGPDYWVRHVGATVRFADGVRALHAAGARAFLEIGPHPVLAGLGERTLDDPECAWLPSLRRGRDGRLTALRAAAALHLRGGTVDWDAVRGGDTPRRVQLPTTPWRGRSFWFRPGDGAGPAAAAGTDVPGLGRRLRTAVPTYELSGGLELAGFLTAAAAAAGDAYGGRWAAVTDAQLAPPSGTVQLVLDTGGDLVRVTARGIGAAEEALGGPWRTHGTLTLRRRVPPVPAAGGTDPTDPTGGTDPTDPTGGTDPTDPTGGSTVVPVSGDPAHVLTAALAAAEPLLGGPATRLSAADLPTAEVRAVRVRAGGTAVEFLGAGGDLLGSVRGLAAEPAATAGWAHPDELLLRLDWEDAPPAEPADPAGAAILLVADPGGPAAETAGRLAAVLTDRGARTTVLPAAGIGAAAAQWRSGVDTARVVLLSALDAPEPAGTDPESLKAALHRDELGLVALVQALADGPPVTVSLVTRGAQAATPDQPAHTVASAALWGLGRVLALEHPDLWGVAVDLDPAAETDPGQLADALLTTGPEDQQALRGGARRVARLLPAPLELPALRRRPAVRAEASYLVTGGLGGIGLAVAGWLAAAGAGKVVLLGRSGLPPRDRWDADDLTGTQRFRVAGVRAAEQLGAEVEIVSADVTDAAEMAAVVRRLATDPRPLRGVVHAAGVSGPQLVRDITPEDYATVWAPKVVGGWLLDRLTADLELELFVSFSSIASVLGSQHLASYAAANAFLDALAHHRRAEGRTALTACWGPWALPSALFGEDVMDFLRSVGLRALDADECLALLGALLAADTTQAIVCAADWAMYKPVMEARRERPVLAHIEAADPAGEAAADGLLAEIRDASGPDRTALVLGYLRSSLGDALGVDGDSLPSGTDVMELGMDSIMAMEVVKRARRDLAVAVRPSVLFEHPTLDE